MEHGKTGGGCEERGDGPGAEAVERCVREAMDTAGVHGLCREGCIEAAVGAVRALRPDWPAAVALAVVRRISEES